MNYFISDLHLNCQNKYEGRTLEHDKNLKENWNKTVTNGDTVYILGDIGREGGIHIDYINESPLYIPFTGNKIYYNIMLDDRAGLSAAYKILYETKERIKNETF